MVFFFLEIDVYAVNYFVSKLIEYAARSTANFDEIFELNNLGK